jgi:hypothetical protein
MPPAENFSVWAVPETVNAIRSNTIILLFVINLFFWFVKNSKRPEFVAAERKSMNLLQEGQPWNMRIRFAVGKETGH